MGTSLVNLPKKHVRSFLHPENQDLVLSMVASGFVFSFWGSINIRPALLTDPSYQEQREGLVRTMNISLLLILAMAGGLSAIYGRRGYIPSLCMAATGAGMYIWTISELNRKVTGSDAVLLQDSNIQTSDSDAVRIKPASVLYTPADYHITSLPPKKRREHSL